MTQLDTAPVAVDDDIDPEELDHYVCCLTMPGEPTRTMCGLDGSSSEVILSEPRPGRGCVVCVSLANARYCPHTNARCTLLP